MESTTSRVLVFALISVLGWQSWSLMTLSGRLQQMEQRLEISSVPVDAASIVVSSSGRAPRQAGRSDEEPKMDGRGYLVDEEGRHVVVVPPAEENGAIRDVVEAAIHRRELERKEEEMESWVSIASESFDIQIEAIAEAYELEPATQERVLDILVDGTRTGMQIKMDVGDGRIGVAEARVLGATLKEEIGAAVVAVIGDEATEALWDQMGKDGKGLR